MKCRTRDGRSEKEDHDKAPVGSFVHDAFLLGGGGVEGGGSGGRPNKSHSDNLIRPEKGSLFGDGTTGVSNNMAQLLIIHLPVEL